MERSVQLTCRDLSLGYEGRCVASDINFTLRQGDYLCVTGQNGTGKSTLVKTLLGLLPALGGEILYGEGLCSRDIGYLPQQNAMQRDFPATVREVVLSGNLGRLGFRPFFGAEEKRRAEENMARVNITDLAQHSYRELSGGQQQRVLLARALCAAGKLLLLDEPVAGLDAVSTRELYDTLHTLNCRDGVTLLMVSHDMAAVREYPSHILNLGGGKPFFGTRMEFLRSPAGRGLCPHDGHEHEHGTTESGGCQHG